MQSTSIDVAGSIDTSFSVNNTAKYSRGRVKRVNAHSHQILILTITDGNSTDWGFAISSGRSRFHRTHVVATELGSFYLLVCGLSEQVAHSAFGAFIC